jgi:hypothetical protein
MEFEEAVELVRNHLPMPKRVQGLESSGWVVVLISAEIFSGGVHLCGLENT